MKRDKGDRNRERFAYAVAVQAAQLADWIPRRKPTGHPDNADRSKLLRLFRHNFHNTWVARSAQ